MSLEDAREHESKMRENEHRRHIEAGWLYVKIAVILVVLVAVLPTGLYLGHEIYDDWSEYNWTHQVDRCASAVETIFEDSDKYTAEHRQSAFEFCLEHGRAEVGAKKDTL